MDGSTGTLKVFAKQEFLNSWSGYLIAVDCQDFWRGTFSTALGLVSVGLAVILAGVYFSRFLRSRAARLSAISLFLVMLSGDSAFCKDDVLVSDADFIEILNGIRTQQSAVRSARMLMNRKDSSTLSDAELLQKHGKTEVTEDEKQEFVFSGGKRLLKRDIRRRSLNVAEENSEGKKYLVVNGDSLQPVEKTIEEIQAEFPDAFKNMLTGEGTEIAHYFDLVDLITIREGSVEVFKAELLEEGPLRVFDPMFPKMFGWDIPDPSSTKKDQSLHAAEIHYDKEGVRKRMVWKEADTNFVRIEQYSPGPSGAIVMKTWLDSSRGHMIVKKIAANESDGKLIVSVDFSKPVEVLKGFWVASQIKIDEYLRQPNDATIAVSSLFECQIQDVNQIDDSIFSPAIKAGSRILKYTTPVGTNGPIQTYVAPTRNAPKDSVRLFTILATIAMVLLVLVVLLRLRKVP